eukprot:6519994-Alexandrium_andersonii.AAC.1
MAADILCFGGGGDVGRCWWQCWRAHTAHSPTCSKTDLLMQVATAAHTTCKAISSVMSASSLHLVHGDDGDCDDGGVHSRSQWGMGSKVVAAHNLHERPVANLKYLNMFGLG